MPLFQVDQVINSFDGIDGIAAAAAHEFRGNNCDVPIHTRHAEAVAALASNRSRDMGAVIVSSSGIKYLRRISMEIEPMDIVLVTVAVVVQTIASFERILPDIWRQVGVLNFDPLINDADIN